MGIEVRTVRRKVSEAAVHALDSFAHAFDLVGRKIVHHHDIAGL